MNIQSTGLLVATVLGMFGAGLVSGEEAPEKPSPPESVTIEYVAHACFRITAPSGDRVLLDPFASRIWIGYDFPAGIEADTILITHPHYDHDGGVSTGRRPPWAQGVKVLREPGEYGADGFKVLGVAGKHADPWGKEFGQTNTIWLLEVAGLRIVHLGDNGPLSSEARSKLGRVDILLIPIDSEYHILKQHEISKIRRDLSPKIVIPMHYRHPDLESEESSPDGLGDIDGWLEIQEGVQRTSSHEVHISTADLPEEQKILVLQHWPKIKPK